jgi:hypothetical protein
VRNRISTAASASAEVAPILPTGLGAGTDIMVLKLFVWSRLFYAARTWSALSMRSLCISTSLYMTAVRIATGENFKVGGVQLTNVQVLEKFRIAPPHPTPPSAHLLRIPRLKLFTKIVLDGDTNIRTHLTAVEFATGSCSATLAEDCVLLRQTSRFNSMPAFSVDPHTGPITSGTTADNSAKHWTFGSRHRLRVLRLLMHGVIHTSSSSALSAGALSAPSKDSALIDESATECTSHFNVMPVHVESRSLHLSGFRCVAN